MVVAWPPEVGWYIEEIVLLVLECCSLQQLGQIRIEDSVKCRSPSWRHVDSFPQCLTTILPAYTGITAASRISWMSDIGLKNIQQAPQVIRCVADEFGTAFPLKATSLGSVLTAR